jgi:hypothetical protein
MTGAAGNRRLLEQAISAALAIGRVDDGPYVAIAYLRRAWPLRRRSRRRRS